MKVSGGDLRLDKSKYLRTSENLSVRLRGDKSDLKPSVLSRIVEPIRDALEITVDGGKEFIKSNPGFSFKEVTLQFKPRILEGIGEALKAKGLVNTLPPGLSAAFLPVLRGGMLVLDALQAYSIFKGEGPFKGKGSEEKQKFTDEIFPRFLDKAVSVVRVLTDALGFIGAIGVTGVLGATLASVGPYLLTAAALGDLATVGYFSLKIAKEETEEYLRKLRGEA